MRPLENGKIASEEAVDSSEPSSDATADTVGLTDSRPALPRGACIGRYLLLDVLGQGGMGVVYKAYDPELDRSIALKLVKAEERTGQFHERLLREAQALARLSHPNVIAVHDVGTFGTDVFIAMEFVEGPTLRRWLSPLPSSPSD